MVSPDCEDRHSMMAAGDGDNGTTKPYSFILVNVLVKWSVEIPALNRKYKAG